MSKIIKVIFDDGTEITPNREIKPIREAEEGESKWKVLREYERQFLSFEDKILESLDQNNLEDYATSNFELTKEDDIEEKDISDFRDEEIMEEVRDRKLLGGDNSIISEQFIARFSKIIEKENKILLDSLLTEFENKLNL